MTRVERTSAAPAFAPAAASARSRRSFSGGGSEPRERSGAHGAPASEPRERSGAHGAPASERVGGAGGAKPPGQKMTRATRVIVALATAVLGLTGSIEAQLFTLGKEEMIKWTAENPYERFTDGRPKVPDWLLERARGLSAEEVLAVLPGKNYRNQFANGFQVLHPGQKLVGRAFTVQFMPVRPDLDAVVNANAKALGVGRMNNQVAIDMLQPGDVLVVDLFGMDENGTIVGDNLFYYIMKGARGAGLVVDGAIRDLEGIRNMAMPAYFRTAHPTAIGNVMLTGINVPVPDRQDHRDAGRPRVRRRGRRLLHSAGARRAGARQRGRDPRARRVVAPEVRRGQVQIARDLRIAVGPRPQGRVPRCISRSGSRRSARSTRSRAESTSS